MPSRLVVLFALERMVHSNYTEPIFYNFLLVVSSGTYFLIKGSLTLLFIYIITVSTRNSVINRYFKAIVMFNGFFVFFVF